jgi:hypothetical protein
MKADPEDPALPTVRVADGEEEVAAAVREVRLLALKHPEAFRAGLAALIAEGETFAQTAEGTRWKQRLERSALLNRAALLWQNIADDAAASNRSRGSTPSQLIDAFFRLSNTPARDRLLDLWLAEALSP